MESFAAIRRILRTVRAKLRRREALRALAYALAALLVVALVGPLVATRVSDRTVLLLRQILVTLAGGTLTAAVVVGIVLPLRRLRREADVARFVGNAQPALASDLLSTVELERELSRDPRFSTQLALALAKDTHQRLEIVDLDKVMPRGRVRRAGTTLLASLVVYAAIAVFLPSTLRAGWSRLTRPLPPAVSERAVPISEPMVGDIRLVVTYPAYTRRAPLVVPAATGDLSAPKGTKIALSTTALRPAVTARLVFDGEGEDPVPLAVAGRTLSGAFTVDKPRQFRFELSPAAGQGRPLIEAEPHRIEVEPDRPPRVELIAPADELDVSDRRRIELAYDIDDDYGISEIALVWKGAGKQERKLLTPPRAGARQAQTKFYWDLNEITLTPGTRIAYHLEVKDNDDVAGPNVGTSKTFYLRVYSPRERHEQIVERQQEVFENMIRELAARLSLGADDLDAHQELHPGIERLVADIASLIAAIHADTLAPKGLKADLEGIHGRLEKLVRDEQTTLGDLLARRQRMPAFVAPRAAFGEHDKKTVAELERGVLALDDWIERQRVEELLAISDELKQHREKLKDLLAQFQRTRSAETRAAIEREMKAIEQRIAELQAKMAKLSSEVADRFMNAEAMDSDSATDCFAKVRELLDKGEVRAAEKQLERCTRMAEEQAAALEAGLRGLRNERFSEEEKAYGELMGEIGDLERDQRKVSADADDLFDRYKERAAEEARGKRSPQQEKAKKTLDKLKKEIGDVSREALTPFSQEELDALRKRLEDGGQMLEEGDIAEALAMARHAQDGLKLMRQDLEDDMADGQPWSPKTEENADKLHDAEPLVEQLIDELQDALPSPQQMMSPEDRQKMQELRRRQRELRERAGRLGQKAEKRAGEMPGQAGEMAQKGLGEAGEMMGRAEERMGTPDPLGARDDAQSAADKLGELQGKMQRSARPSSVPQGRQDGNGVDEDTVKIPGSDQYKPPEAFREDILDAMKKEKPPEAFKDQVKRYYEELTR